MRWNESLLRYRALLQSEHYYDIFFFDPDGNCIYSVSKDIPAAHFFSNARAPEQAGHMIAAD